MYKIIALNKIIDENNLKYINLFNADYETKIFIKRNIKKKRITFNSINDKS